MIDRNTLLGDKGNHYSIEINKLDSDQYSATAVQLSQVSGYSSDYSISTVEYLILKAVEGNELHIKSEKELEQERKAQEEKAKKEAPAKAKEEAEKKKKEIKDFKSSCKNIPYKDLARNPESYSGDNALYTDEVIQVMEEENILQLRVNVTATQYGYTDTLFVHYIRSVEEDRILEDDIIILWGTVSGDCSPYSISMAPFGRVFQKVFFIGKNRQILGHSSKRGAILSVNPQLLWHNLV